MKKFDNDTKYLKQPTRNTVNKSPTASATGKPQVDTQKTDHRYQVQTFPLKMRGFERVMARLLANLINYYLDLVTKIFQRLGVRDTHQGKQDEAQYEY